jgi:hypothetical protein
MKTTSRRDFVKASLAASAAAALRGTAAKGAGIDAAGGRDYLELRSYRLKPGAPHDLLDAYLKGAFIPALNARGIRAVGVFTEPEASDGAAVWVLVPHPSPESLASVTAELNKDAGVRASGALYLESPTPANPAFDRVDSWLLLSFAGLPRLAVPALAKAGMPRVFEMRTYESYGELKALKKIEMFNSGEIALMQELGLSPVFYGQALVGRDLPHLTYMLCSPDKETHKRNWAAFGAHPAWLKLKNDPQYADTVSKITSRFLAPAPYSQI